MNHSRKKKWEAGACKLAGSKPKSVTMSLPGDVCTSKASWAISTQLPSLNHHHIIPCIWFLVHCLHLFSGFPLLSFDETCKSQLKCQLERLHKEGLKKKKKKFSSISDSIIQFASNASDLMRLDQLILGKRNIYVMPFGNTASLIQFYFNHMAFFDLRFKL